MMLFRKMFSSNQGVLRTATAAPTLTFANPSFFLAGPASLRAFSASMIHGQSLRVTQKDMPFATDSPAKSSRHHRGLYHGKTHGRRFQRCFSMKKSIVTMKPNVKSRNLRSETLDQSFKLDITTKARRCIMKAGSLDNYLLQTKPADIDSKFGLYLRDLIKQKQRNPEFIVPYIKGQADLTRNRKTSVWEYKQVPAMFMPAHIRASEDHSKYYLKTPQEMSRFEIAGLEQMLREIDEPDEFVPDEELYASQEF